MEYQTIHNILCFITIIVCVLSVGVDSQGTCTKIDSCSCTYGDNQVVDLKALTGNPKFADQWDPSFINTYSYNPCKPFNKGTGCSDVAMCQFNGADYYALGTQDSATFANDPISGALSVQYVSVGGDGITRTSQVVLTCDTGGTDAFKVQGETAPGSTLYLFELSSSHCCPGAAPGPGGGGGSGGEGISIGSILVIGFFALGVVYFAGGIIFLKFGRKASGTEAMPNRGFWGALPGLVKDGTGFVIRRGKRSGYNQV